MRKISYPEMTVFVCYAGDPDLKQGVSDKVPVKTYHVHLVREEGKVKMGRNGETLQSIQNFQQTPSPDDLSNF